MGVRRVGEAASLPVKIDPLEDAVGATGRLGLVAEYTGDPFADKELKAREKHVDDLVYTAGRLQWGRVSADSLVGLWKGLESKPVLLAYCLDLIDLYTTLKSDVIDIGAQREVGTPLAFEYEILALWRQGFEADSTSNPGMIIGVDEQPEAVKAAYGLLAGYGDKRLKAITRRTHYMKEAEPYRGEVGANVGPETNALTLLTPDKRAGLGGVAIAGY